MTPKPQKFRPAFGIELRRAGRSVVRVFSMSGEVLYQGPTARVSLALPWLPMGPSMLVAESELRCGQFATADLEGWDHEAVKRASEAGLL